MPNDRFARTPKPPYYAAVVAAQRTSGDRGYGATAARMTQLAASMPSYLGLETARDETGFGMTVSYWRSGASIRHWKQQIEHKVARERGNADWYDHDELRVAKVERTHGRPG